MKISKTALQKIIQEVISEQIEHPGDVEHHANDFVDSFVDVWHEAYDPDDPSMQAIGEKGWEQQIEAAAEELKKQIIKSVAEVEDKLMNGEYYLGDATHGAHGSPFGHRTRP